MTIVAVKVGSDATLQNITAGLDPAVIVDRIYGAGATWHVISDMPVVAPGWKSLTWSNTPPYFTAVYPSIQEVRADGITRVNQEAERQRLLYIVDGSGQSLTYSDKFTEAQRWVESQPQVPVPADWPWLTADVEARGGTLNDAANRIVATGLQWTALGAQIEKVRIQAGDAINAASTAAAVQAIITAIVWPTP